MKKVIPVKIHKKERQWEVFVENNRFQEGIDELVVDFGPCWFVGPFHAVLLACLKNIISMMSKFLFNKVKTPN